MNTPLKKSVTDILQAMTAMLDEATEVDLKDNYAASERLVQNIRHAQRNLDELTRAVRKKQHEIRGRAEKMKETDETGEPIDMPINQ